MTWGELWSSLQFLTESQAEMRNTIKDDELGHQNLARIGGDIFDASEVELTKQRRRLQNQR